MTDFLTIEECAERARVSVSTIKRELRDGKLKPSRIRGRTIIAAPDWQEYVQSCRSENMGVATKSAYSTPMAGLARLLRIDETPRNTKNSSSDASKIVELEGFRDTGSKKP